MTLSSNVGRMRAPLLVLFTLLAAVPAAATTYTWNDDAGGAWSDAARWTPNGVPGSADVAILPALSSDYVVTLDQAPAATELHLATGAALELGAYALDGVSETWNAGRLGGFRGTLDSLRPQPGWRRDRSAATARSRRLNVATERTILVGPNPENVLWLASATTITGSGTVRLSGQATVNCALARPQNTIWLTIGAGQTFAGAGDVWVPVKVYGRMLQDFVSGPELVLHTYLRNYGTIRVQDGGWINVDCPLVKQFGGDRGQQRRSLFSSARTWHGRQPDGGNLVADGEDLLLLARWSPAAASARRRGSHLRPVRVGQSGRQAGAVLRIGGLLAPRPTAPPSTTTARSCCAVQLRRPPTNHLTINGTRSSCSTAARSAHRSGPVTNSAGHTITGCGARGEYREPGAPFRSSAAPGGLVLKDGDRQQGRILVKRGYLRRNALKNSGAIDGQGGTLKVEYGKIDNRAGRWSRAQATCSSAGRRPR
jgi:hypothetical protein